MEWETIIANGVFLLVGSIIGGACSYFGTKKGIEMQIESEKTERKMLINNLLNTLLADEIEYNIKQIMSIEVLKLEITKRSKGETANQYGHNSNRNVTEQFNKVEQIILNNITVETKYVLDLYRFIKFYNRGGVIEINEYPIDAAKDFMTSVRYFENKYRISYVKK